MKAKPATCASLLASLSHSRQPSEVFRTFARMAACALAAETREKEYLEEAARWTRPELDTFGQALGALTLEMEARPYEDLLGPVYMETLSVKGQQWNGEFHTPHSVCQLMARMMAGEKDLPADGPITLCEPACGAGAMILAFAEAMAPEARRRLRVTAIDINATACDMTFINTTLWHIPCHVIRGDTLRMEFNAAWSNIHWLMPWLSRCLQVPPQGAPPDIHEATALRRALHSEQLNFELQEAAA